METMPEMTEAMMEATTVVMMVATTVDLENDQ
jgi:hypothetical protein